MSVSSFRSSLLSRFSSGGFPVVARTIKEIRNLRQAMDLLSYEGAFNNNRQQRRRRDAGLHTEGRGAHVGFVPTMGFLHKGHLDLISRAKDRSDIVLSSIFVNPTQFAPHEDLSRYPRAFESDLAKLGESGCDAVFAPAAVDMYPLGRGQLPIKTFVTPLDADVLTPEGVARPGFFRGVSTVVSKLFNLTRPALAVFGQKDGVQCIVVRQMVRDLNFDIQIEVARTTREADGLAMSSRNSYLTPDQRAAAPAIYKALLESKKEFETSPEFIIFNESRNLSKKKRIDDEKHSKEMDESKRSIARQEREANVNVAAQKATVQAREGVKATTLGKLDPILKRASERFYETLKINGNGLLGDPQYLTFSDALSGHPISSLNGSTARNGAVMLSTAVPIVNNKTLRLIDNEMFVGDVEDIGADEDEY